MSSVMADAETLELRPGAFTGPIDLFRLSLGRKPAAVDVCSKCLSLSKGSALRCHACNARLPACPVALVCAESGRTRDTEFSNAEAWSRLRSGWLERPLLGFAIAIAIAMAMTMACLSGAATQANWRSDPQARADGNARAPARSSGARAPVRAEQVAVEERAVSPVLAVQTPSMRVSILPVASLAGPDRRRVKAARPEARVDRAMTACGDRNFLSRAICMNNRCAESATAPSASCVSALSQRRLDEARRNPLLVG